MMGEFFRRIYYLLNRRRLERELRNDIEVHREMLGDNRKNFGNATLLQEQSHQCVGLGMAGPLLPGHPLWFANAAQIACHVTHCYCSSGIGHRRKRNGVQHC